MHDGMNDPRYDQYFAPGISDLSSCNAPDLSAVRRPCVLQFVINANFKRVVPDRDRALLYNFVRRANNALSDYSHGLENLSHFIDSRKSDFRTYLAAVHNFESVVAELVACHLLLFRVRQKKFFSKNDGSALARMYLMNNEIKHAESSFDDPLSEPSSTLPLWITNDGLRSHNSRIAWGELGVVVVDVATAANNIARLD